MLFPPYFYPSPLIMFAMLLLGHCLGDFPLQGDFLAGAKNPRLSMQGVPWWIALTAHSIIQAGIVGLVTGSLTFGIAEFLAHWIIDFAKCHNRFGFAFDQLLHVACKVIWILCLACFA